MSVQLDWPQEILVDVVYSPEVAKLDVIEERLGNHLWVFRAVVAGAVGWMAYLNVQINGIQKSLSRIEATVKISTATDTLEKAVRADAKDAGSALEAARKVIKTASLDKIPIDPNLAIKVANRAIGIATSEGQPALQVAAWETVQEAANYASLYSNPEAVKLLSARLPECLEGNGPKGGAGGLFDTNISKDGKQFSLIPKKYFHDCVLILDKAKPNTPTFELVGPVTFERCIVRYSGGTPALVGSFYF